MLRRLLTGTAQAVSNLSTLGLKKEFPFVRHAMYNRIRDLFRTVQPKTGAVLSISYSKHLCDIMGLENVRITEANYPEVSVLNLPFPDNTFDWVLSDQVFEHIEGDPQVAINESLRILKPGGIMVHTTCFLIPYHGPGDFWRYTPEGLAYLCRNASKVLASDGWGHPLVCLFTYLGFTWTLVPVARWHPLNWFARLHRPSYDYMVWVAAQK
jgi:SAM-dependent methyltransferase